MLLLSATIAALQYLVRFTKVSSVPLLAVDASLVLSGCIVPSFVFSVSSSSGLLVLLHGHIT